MPLTPPAPNPVVKASKWFIHHIADTFIAPYVTLYDWVAGSSSIADMQWRKVMIRFNRGTPTGTVEDQATISFHIANITGGDLDTSWTTTDYTQCEAALNEFLTAMTSYMSDSHSYQDMRWYLMRFNPDVPQGTTAPGTDPATGKPWKRFLDSGPPQRVTPVTGVGASGGVTLPYQDSVSITLRTAVPHHWGRVYWPGMTSALIDTAGDRGRLLAAATTAIANQTAELIDDLGGNQFQLLVPTTQAGGKYHFGMNSVNQVQVDDIPDVIRRRRPRTPKLRTIGVPLP